jgi:hypothetical protein
MAKEIAGLNGFHWVYPNKDNPWGEKVSTRTAYNPSTGEKLTVRQAQTKSHGGVSYEKRKATEAQQKQKQAPKITSGGEGKPTPIKPTKTKGIRGYGRHIQHQRDEKGQIVRTRINATSTDTLHKQFDRVPNGSGVILHFVNSRTGETVKAVSKGRNHTANIDNFRQRVKDRMAKGASWDEAFWGEVYDSFSLYDEDGNAVSILPSGVTNIIMYSEAA